MKHTCTLKTYTGSLCRIYVTPASEVGGPPCVEAVVADFPTGRVPAFLLQIITRTPAIKKHVRKIDVDGFTHGHHLSYVTTVAGVQAIIDALKATSPYTQANIDATANLCTWFTHHLIPHMQQLAATTAPAAPVATATTPCKITISTYTTEFTVEHLDPDEDVVYIEYGGRSIRKCPRDFFQALGLL